MLIMLRGHVRNSFNDNLLYSLIKNISLKTEIKIYIHTWNIVQSNVSWRNLNKIEVTVDENLIRNYFKDLSLHIKEIIIDDDRFIKLEGNTQGFVSFTRCPKIGWKNMWYGKKRLIDKIKEDIIDINESILNMRFDIISNSNSLNPDFILKFVEENKNRKHNKIIFASDREFMGIDNLYIGDLNTMFNIIYNFHYNLDNILLRHRVQNQEYVVFRENNLMII